MFRHSQEVMKVGINLRFRLGNEQFAYHCYYTTWPHYSKDAWTTYVYKVEMRVHNVVSIIPAVRSLRRTCLSFSVLHVNDTSTSSCTCNLQWCVKGVMCSMIAIHTKSDVCQSCHTQTMRIYLTQCLSSGSFFAFLACGS